MFPPLLSPSGSNGEPQTQSYQGPGLIFLGHKTKMNGHECVREICVEQGRWEAREVRVVSMQDVHI